MKRLLTLFVFLVCSILSYGQDITIGTGTTTTKFPLGNFYGFERSAALYTAAEVSQTGFINKIAWDIGKTGGPRPIKIYLKEITTSPLAGDTWNGFIQGATLVYDGVFNPALIGYNTFQFNQSFSYTGGANNLLVLVEANHGGGGNGEGSGGLLVKSSSATNMHFGQSIDNSPNNAATLTAQSSRPNIKLSFGAKITCITPTGLKTNSITDNSIAIDWNVNSGATSYDVYISTTSTEPSTSTTVVNVTTTNHTFTNLNSNTDYYIWVRSRCSATDESFWSSPLVTRTQCGVVSLPFWEGFNTDSDGLVCWTIIDGNTDSSTSPTSSGIWRTTTTSFEGNQSMYFYGYTTNQAKLPHNDWLISPKFQYNPGKTYRLKYHYRTSTTTTYDYEFEVLLSDSGSDVSDFTKVLVPKKKYPPSSDWVEEYLFFTGVTADFQIAWHVTSPTTGTYLYIDNVFVEEVANCPEPIKLSVSGVTDKDATLGWTDTFGTAWQYYVQEEGIGLPNGSAATATTQKSLTITQDNLGNPLLGDTLYEYFVRTDCGNGEYSDWAGPFKFKTKCAPISVFPFEEGFNTNSTTFQCWTIVDNKPNSTSATNTWRQYSSTVYEGDRTMYFYATGSPNDDYLISPAFTLTGGNYEVSYYYRSTSSANTEYEVLMSTTGTNLSDFTTTVMPMKKIQVGDYTKAVHNITGVTGNVNIAIRIVNSGYATMYLDKFRIESVGCFAPEQTVNINSITSNTATLAWTDSYNTSWDYAVVAANAPAPTAGSGTTNKTVTLTQTTGAGAAALQPNTEYDFYVRSSCNDGKSKWVGPIRFRTLCTAFSSPYWEGFNNDSQSIDCWTTLNNGSNSGSYSWNTSTTRYEGTHSMYFYGYNYPAQNHDAWLISPTFNVAANKYYSLRYHYRTSAYNKTSFDVLSSTTGSSVANFTTKLLTNKDVSIDGWKEERITISSTTNGTISFAWHINGNDTSTYFYIDNVFFEEIDCPEPYALGVSNLTDASVTLNWTDNYGANWEYFVQESGKAAPTGTTAGTASNAKTVNVTKTSAGVNLQPNTEYEYYVRTMCGVNGESVWIGPFVFRTDCGVYNLPFWEGFNQDSETTRCWQIIDANKDSTSPTSSGIWYPYQYTYYEGSGSMYFYGYTTDQTKLPHNDWVISPKMKYNPGKTYRLKYHYRTSTTSSYDYEFEVLLSDTNSNMTSFNKTIVPKKKYPASSNWVEEYVFFTGVTANFQLAWHVTSPTSGTYLYIDNVFIEEVEGCPEPLPSTLGAKDPGKKDITLFWDDKFGATKWEYFIQGAGDAKPSKTDKGISTTIKQVVATKDGKGNNLKGNTDYEYYVRTDCGNGEYSIWSGPFKFTTLCDYYDAPFWEGFNTGEVQIRCWSTIDKTGAVKSVVSPWSATTPSYEGDRAVYFSLYNSAKTPYDDWLVSPEIDLDGGQYVLKYHYRTNTNATYNPEFEVVVSTNGVVPSEFKKVLVPSTIKREGNYVEEVVFFSGVTGKANIAWHINATNTQYSYFYLDNVFVKKVETCPEPYYVKTTNQTSTSVDVSWSQTGGITSWEVVVVAYGDPITGPIVQTVQVSGNPNTTITGLSPNTPYTVYVYAKCDGSTDKSDPSTGASFGTKLGGNIDCNTALNIPVTENSLCEQKVKGTLKGALAGLPAPSCNTNLVKDAWFEFTATGTQHYLTISDLMSFTNQALSVSAALYIQDCNTLVPTTARECFTLSNTTPFRMLTNLVAGQKYYIRLGVASTVVDPDLVFELCISTPKYLDTSDQSFTVEELVKDVLVISDCDLVSNVTSITGSNFGQGNGIGYFTNESNLFPFKEGIVLATNGRQHVSGPQGQTHGSNTATWVGDVDLNRLLISNGQTNGNNNASVLEFDFIPIIENISFNFLFASEEYGTYQCSFADVFAFFLTDLTTGEVTNLAVVPDTNIPVAVTTIRDKTYNSGCESANVEYFGKYFPSAGLPAVLDPINYRGMTIPMVAKSKVQPGRKYHIKLAIANYSDTAFQSAVFLEAGSFDLGSLDMGADLTVDNGTALCDGELRVIDSGLTDDPETVTISWYKDGELIEGETSSKLSISETGTYRVVGHYNEISCEIEGQVYAEIFPPIHTVVNPATNIDLCRFATMETPVDLNVAVQDVFNEVNSDDYSLEFYSDEALNNLIENSENYSVGSSRLNQVIYYKIEDLRTGCTEVFNFEIIFNKGLEPIKPADVLACDTYVLPDIDSNQTYYTSAGGNGTAYQGGDILGPGIHDLYLFQDNGDFCYEEVIFRVEVTKKPELFRIEDQTLECEIFELPELPEDNKYFIEVEGVRFELMPGTLITETNTTIFIVAETADKICYEETSFTVRYNDCPIPKGFSPNGDGINDTFDLSNHGVTSLKVYNRAGVEVYSYGVGYTNQWYGQDKKGKELSSGTYYYVIQAFDKTRTGWVQINK